MRPRFIGVFVVSTGTFAQGFCLSSSDARLREALTLLVDQRVLRLPVNEWALVRQDVAEVLALVKPEDPDEPALLRAPAIVQAATRGQTARLTGSCAKCA